ncbi:hypothetical protein SADUNF_Sadunf12G0086300 [Salix dunnii]|uniref:Germin-like protein n=1 Tax=Salix dunnii TaxID=1413687 RepID=A0A835JRQ1_9ROSI|nr:hypothetical protein SADUNF_Sadunf12G0086300 [Salix dunnii]
MMKFTLFFCIFLCPWITICLAESDNLQDTCPTATTGKQTFFINGFPCKNPNSIVASDFKSSKLSHPGDTHNFLRSSLTLDTAADFPGLNTLGLSIARTDLEVDGLTVPHSHPRASEMLFVSTGLVIAGFFDTQKKMFPKSLKTGEVFVVPQGLLHFIINDGDEAAVIFSVLNSQNPGVAKIVDAEFESDKEMIDTLARKIKSAAASELEEYGIQNVTLTESKHVHIFLAHLLDSSSSPTDEELIHYGLYDKVHERLPGEVATLIKDCNLYGEEEPWKKHSTNSGS